MCAEQGRPESVATRPQVWVVRGAPGVGKSALGRRLKRTLPAAAVVEVDVLRSMRSDVDWTDRESHHLGLRVAAEVVRCLLAEGTDPVVVIDTLLGDALDYFLSRLDCPVRVFTLTAQDDALVGRARGRGSGFQNRQVMLEMNRWFQTHAKADAIVIDTTNRSADEVATEVLGSATGSWKNTPPANPVAASPMVLPGDVSGGIVFVRHARPDRTFSGPYDVAPGPPLSGGGVKQALELSDFFRDWRIDEWVASPFERALQTARIISCEGAVVAEAEAWGELGPSEPYREVRSRVRKWLETHLPRRGETILVVGHGASLNAAIELLVPNAFRASNKDRHGNVVPQGGAWTVEWRGGEMVKCEEIVIPHRASGAQS